MVSPFNLVLVFRRGEHHDGEGRAGTTLLQGLQHAEGIDAGHVQVHDRQADAGHGMVLLVEFEEVGTVPQVDYVDVFVNLKEGTLSERSFERVILDQ